MTVVTAGQLFYGIATALWLQAPPFPSTADAFYLTSYAFLLSGLTLLIHDLGGRRNRTGVVDSLIVTIGFGHQAT